MFEGNSFESHSYDIELLIKKNDFENMNQFIEYLNTIFSSKFNLLVEPENISEGLILIWDSGKRGDNNYDNLKSLIRSEFGENTKIVEVNNIELDITNINKILTKNNRQ